MKLDEYNEIFVSDVDLYKKNIKRDLHLKDRPTVKSITEGIILPLKKEYTPRMVYRGGVCDAEFNFLGGFIRCKENKKTWATCSEAYKVPDENIEYVDDTVVFGGVLIGAFGHVLLECLSRLWWFCENMDCEHKFIFLMDCKPPAYILDFFELLGLKKEQIVFLEKPTKFSHVILPEESMHTYSGFTDKYISIYDRIKERCGKGKYEKVYLTRTQFSRRDIANETFFEEFFEKQGYQIVAPEKLSLKKQVQILAGAKKVACTIGTLSHMVLFSDNNVELIAMSSASNFVAEQLIVNQARKVNCIYIDVTMNFLPYNHRAAGVLIGPNKNFINYLLRYGIPYSDKEFENNIKGACHDYLKVWSDLYSNPRVFKEFLQDYKFDIKDLLMKIHDFVYDKSKRHISIVGSCVLRDIFNSNFVAEWGESFIIDSYFARTTMPSLVGKPIPYDIKVLEKDFNQLYFEYNYTECSKNMLITLENNKSDYILLDFYADAYYGTYQYDDSYIKGSLFDLKTSKAIDTAKIKKFYNFNNSPEEYYSIWCKAFDMFMEYARKHFPTSKLVINGILCSNKITDKIDGEVIKIQQPQLDLDKLNAFQESLNSYCEKKYNIPVIRYEKQYTLNPNYIFGLNRELVHFHNNYYKDAFDKILGICKYNGIEQHINTNVNLIRNSNFAKGIRFWSFENCEWDVKDNMLIPPTGVTSFWKWIWCDPIEICANGEDMYTLSFDVTYNDREVNGDLPIFGIRAFKNAVQKEVADCVYSEIVKIPRDMVQCGKSFRYSHTFRPKGKFIRVAPHIKADIDNICFSNIQLQKGTIATPYKCAPIDVDDNFLTIEDM